MTEATEPVTKKKTASKVTSFLLALALGGFTGYAGSKGLMAHSPLANSTLDSALSYIAPINPLYREAEEYKSSLNSITPEEVEADREATRKGYRSIEGVVPPAKAHLEDYGVIAKFACYDEVKDARRCVNLRVYFEKMEDDNRIAEVRFGTTLLGAYSVSPNIFVNSTHSSMDWDLAVSSIYHEVEHLESLYLVKSSDEMNAMSDAVLRAVPKEYDAPKIAEANDAKNGRPTRLGVEFLADCMVVMKAHETRFTVQAPYLYSIEGDPSKWRNLCAGVEKAAVASIKQ